MSKNLRVAIEAIKLQINKLKTSLNVYDNRLHCAFTKSLLGEECDVEISHCKSVKSQMNAAIKVLIELQQSLVIIDNN
jgi:hypothetical protein